jgi:hypothetical protein
MPPRAAEIDLTRHVTGFGAVRMIDQAHLLELISNNPDQRR